MAGGVLDQQITDRWAIYNGDCLEVMAAMPAQSIHLSVYSPPFAGLYHYSSSDRDLSNARTYAEFLEHYGYVIEELRRLTLPGRISAVHCMDVPRSNTGRGDSLVDFPGDIIQLHERIGWGYVGRHVIWKEPLAVRNRTLTKGLAHRTIVDDSAQASIANADYLLILRNCGDNPIPITHPTGLRRRGRETRPPAPARRDHAGAGAALQPRRACVHPVPGCGQRGVRGGAAGPVRARRRAQDLLLPAGRHQPRRGGPPRR